MAARRILLAWVLALVTTGGCGVEVLSITGSSPKSTPGAGTPQTMSSAYLKAVLLSPLDLPSSAVAPSDDEGASAAGDASAASDCGGDPAGEEDPNLVERPLLVAGEGRVLRFYTSIGTLLPPDMAAEVVALFSRPGGADCLLNIRKTSIASDPDPPRVDPSGLTATTAAAAVGQGGVLLPISGTLKAAAVRVPMAVEMVVFHQAGTMVMLMAYAAPGAPFPVRVMELAHRVEARLL